MSAPVYRVVSSQERAWLLSCGHRVTEPEAGKRLRAPQVGQRYPCEACGRPAVDPVKIAGQIFAAQGRSVLKASPEARARIRANWLTAVGGIGAARVMADRARAARGDKRRMATACTKGHLYEDTPRLDRYGYRRCRTCSKLAARRRRAKRQEAKAS